MRIEVERIKNNHIDLEEEVGASDWELDSFDVKFIRNIHLKCNFMRAGKEILVRGSVSTFRLITCSRCLIDAEQEVNQEFNLSYDVEMPSDYLDVDRDVREEVLLHFPMKVLCKPDCKGICSGCGVNLNIDKCHCKVKIKNTNRRCF